MLDTHKLNSASVTMLLKELDPAQKPKGSSENYDIFGLAEWQDNPRILDETH
jgi:hypothetical protein